MTDDADPRPKDEVMVNALQAWTRGEQSTAVDLVRPVADAGDHDAEALISWFFQQRGEPYWREGVPYAISAARAGRGWTLNYYLGTMIADPTLRTRLPELMQAAAASGGLVIDPLPQALVAMQNGDRATAARLMHIVGPDFRPEDWPALVSDTRAASASVEDIASEVRARRDAVVSELDSIANDLSSQRERIETQASQLLVLLDQTTNAEAKSFFDKEAEQNQKEAWNLWRIGVAVLMGATFLALVPLIRHYFGFGTALSNSSLLTAHLAPTVALGAVAGVILSRARVATARGNGRAIFPSLSGPCLSIAIRFPKSLKGSDSYTIWVGS